MAWQSLARRTLNRLGFELLRWPAKGSLGYELHKLFAARPISTVIDIGAHEGGFGKLIRAMGFGGRIVSFEPSPVAFERLTAQGDARWEMHRLALGERQDRAVLNQFANSQLNSLHQKSDWAEDHWRFGATLDPVEVDVITLDDALSRFGVEPTNLFVKIDTQGHDAAVLRGGEKAIAHAQALQLEVPAIRLYEGTESLRYFLDFALDLGFELLALVPIERETVERLIPVEFDALFVRSHLPRAGS
jgi:FkbM family methyltransferase